MSQRVEKINELVGRYMNEIITRELDIKPGVFITLTKVDTSPDFRYTSVSVSIFPEKETDYVSKTLAKEIYKIQGALNRKMPTKILPRLRFKIDTTESQADEIEKLLRQ